MDDLFSKLALQAVTTVGKAAFGMAVNKAVQRLKDYSESSTKPSRPASVHTDRDGSDLDDHDDQPAAAAAAAQEQMSDELRHEFHQLDDLRAKLQQKVAILTPSIDMIQVVCAKSNNLGLHAVLNMASDLNVEMDELSVLLNQVLAPACSSSSSSTPAGAAAADRSPADTLALARAVTARVQRIMDKIEDSVPYINLALSISGVKLGQFTPASSSSSALLPGGGISLHTWFNASNLVAASEPDDFADGEWVPMAFPCRVYRLFEASVRKDGLPNWTWKLEHLMSSVHVWRHRPDGRAAGGASKLVVHELTPMPGEQPQVLAYELAQLKAMFFTATGRLLNIPDANPGMPVLVMHLDEYVAIEIVDARELQDDDEDSESEDSATSEGEADEEADELPMPIRKSRKTNIPPSTPTRPAPNDRPWLHPPPASSLPTSHNLALLESVLRLVALEHTLGTSHLAVPDDVLWVHLSSDQSPSIGSMAQQPMLPLPPAYSTPSTPPTSTRAGDAGSGGSASARRRSRRSLTAAAAAAAASGPVTPTAAAPRGGKRPKSRMAEIRDGGEPESGPATPEAGVVAGGEGKLQRTPAPVRALNLMERFMSLDKDKKAE